MIIKSHDFRRFQDSDLDDSDLDVDDDSDELGAGQRGPAMRPSRPSGAGRRLRPQAEEGEESEDDF